MARAAAVAKPSAPPRRRRASATPRRLPCLLIAPAALLMPGFIAHPVLSVFCYGPRDYNPTKPWRNGWAALDNFVQAFTKDPQFWDALTFSARRVVVEVGIGDQRGPPGRLGTVEGPRTRGTVRGRSVQGPLRSAGS
ncbi:hypothetical protein GCM10010510_54390 [Streptomyces anandii JCM 4720]|nr:hypothetical protein GCM10010510_54390 [Streptomyces anandii JCM 4720]